MDVDLRDNGDEQRFEGLVDGKVAAYVRYHRRASDGAVVLVHTEVEPAYEGEGVGSALAKATLDELRGRGSRIVPLCPFIASYIRRHPEYDDLVVS
jgi:uncharacterized protein